MLTLMNKVYRELQTKVSSNGISTTKEISTTILVPKFTNRLGDGSGLPASLLYPISMQERRSASTDDFVDMDEMDFEPSFNPPLDYLKCWAWREDELKFSPCSADREVLIRFVQTLGNIIDVNSPILILNSQQWMAQRLAAIAAMHLGSNPNRAAALDADLVPIWDDLRINLVRRMQSIPVRRRRTRYRVP